MNELIDETEILSIPCEFDDGAQTKAMFVKFADRTGIILANPMHRPLFIPIIFECETK